jgi:hypothetical protein
MKRSKLTLIGAFLLANAVAGTYAFAAGSDLPPEKTQGLVKYLSGGVGKDEAKAVKRIESKYPLSLEFVQHAKPKDEFLADIDVTIKNKNGKEVLKTKTDGPFLLAKVPSGQYTVIANENGKVLERHVTIENGKPEHLIMVWS